MNDETLTAFVGRQRWFGGKGRTWRVAGSQTLAWLQHDPPVRIAVVELAYDDGPPDLYQLPLLHLDAPVEALSHALVGEDDDTLGRRTWAYDALHAKEVTSRWLEGIARQCALEGEGGTAVAFHRDPDATDVPVDGPSLVLGAEQSNTSLVFGDAAILKVFRRLTPGLNPDIELQTALSRVGCRHIAAPLGWVEGRWHPPGSVGGGGLVEGSLAILQQFLRNAVDGWEQALASVRDLLAEGDLHADEVGGDFAGDSYRLGVATAEVHLDLARALPTGTAGADRLGGQAAEMRGRLERAVDAVPALAPYADGLRQTYDALGALDVPVRVQRIHGDLHLGQVLRTTDGWKLLDFEGEPAKSLEERRGLDSPMRDVAGMLRSFDYASRHLLGGGPASSDPQREYRAAEWSERNRGAFCDGYTKASGIDPRTTPDGTDVLLRAFETDKAVYEVMYETRNRPGWVRVPLAAIERLANAGSSR